MCTNDYRTQNHSESEYFTGDTSLDIHSPGSVVLTSDVNVATGS